MVRDENMKTWQFCLHTYIRGTSLPFIWPPPEHLQTPPPFQEPVLPSPPPESLLAREIKLDALRFAACIVVWWSLFFISVETYMQPAGNVGIYLHTSDVDINIRRYLPTYVRTSLADFGDKGVC